MWLTASIFWAISVHGQTKSNLVGQIYHGASTDNVTITILSSGYVDIKYSYVARFNIDPSFNCLHT